MSIKGLTCVLQSLFLIDLLSLTLHSAMNRSIANVLIGGFGDGAGAGASKAKKAEGVVREASAEDVLEMMLEAKSMIIVPGYGMAVAKAQHAVAELTTKLRAMGNNVRFAIHPVAGRLPGHMNVLLAEAHVVSSGNEGLFCLLPVPSPSY